MVLWRAAEIKEREYLASVFPEINKYKLVLKTDDRGLILDATSWDNIRMCIKCCWGDRCDNYSHYYRPECPFCKATGINQEDPLVTN